MQKVKLEKRKMKMEQSTKSSKNFNAELPFAFASPTLWTKLGCT